jgi:[ribosomal protein S18]-alanine N-acetyltransferase
MTIKAVTSADDLSGLARLHKACFARAWTEEAMRDLLEIAGTLALYAPHGFVMARVMGDEAEILTIAVAPGARRGGVGSALLCEAARHAYKQGARAMFLEVAEFNAAAMALYARARFREIGRRKCYYGPSEDALVLRADLPLIPLGNSKASTRL